MKRIALCFFSILFIYFPLLSQDNQGEVSGYVLHDKKPVPAAVITIEGSNKTATTDSTGFFRISNLAPGSYFIKVNAEGYRSLSQKIIIAAGEITRVNLFVIEIENQLREVVITGTMKEVSKTNSPIPVEVYHHSYFKKNPTPNVFEGLQIVNGVQPQLNCNVCNTGDIHINGMEGPYTMVTIDGMPIVSSLSTVYGLSGIPNSMIERIEIVKGPASTLYGSEAVGGVINIITKDPGKAPLLSIDAFATAHQEYNVDVFVKTRAGKSTSLLGINYFNFQNRMDVNKDNFTDITLQDRISIFNKWSFHRKENRLATLAARFVYEDRWGGEMQWERAFRGGDSIYGESIFTRRYELIGAYQLPFKEMVRLQYSFNSHFQNSAYGDMIFLADQHVAFAQILWDKKIGARHDLLAGLPFRYTYYDDNTPATASADSLQPENRPQHIFLPGIFVQDQISLTDKLSTLAGLRYDHHSGHGSIFSPRLSFKFNPNPMNTFRLSGGNGYRVVNLFTEDHAALTGARQVVIADELRPEKSYNVNLNYQKFINLKKGFLGLDGSIFYTYFSNKIIGDFLTDQNKIIYDNLEGYAISKGLTLNTDLNFSFPLKAIMGITLMDVYSVEQDEKGEFEKLPQLHAPRFSGVFAITYFFSKARIAIDYTGRVMGPMHLPVLEDDFRPDMSPWFSLQNIQITKTLKKGWEVYGGVKNLLNFIPQHPLIRPFDPFDRTADDPVNNPYGYTFDPSYNYAPVQGIRTFMGVRYIPGIGRRIF